MTDRELKLAIANAYDNPETATQEIERIKNQLIDERIMQYYKPQEERAIVRKHLAGIDNGEFAVYNDTVEKIKREEKERIARLVQEYGR